MRVSCMASLNLLLCSYLLLIEILLEPGKNLANIFRLAKVGHSLRNRIVILQQKQRPQFFLVELFHADLHIM